MTDRARGWALVAAQFGLLTALVLAPGGDAWPVPAWLRTVGTAGRVAGFVGVLVGAARLGPAASVHPEPTDTAELRTSGPYRWVRHPIYTGVLVLAAAITATSGSWAHAGSFAALVGVLAVKARFEERLLAARFPGYRAYAARTGRFLPRPPRPVVQIGGSRRVQIDAPARLVWSMVAEVTDMGRWSPITTNAAWVPPATGPAVGARFTGTNRLPLVRRWTSPCTVTECDPGRRFAFAVGKDPIDPNTTWSYDFDQQPDGTTLVTEAWTMHREPLVVLVYYRLVGQADRIAAGVETTLARLAIAAEATHRHRCGTRRDP